MPVRKTETGKGQSSATVVLAELNCKPLQGREEQLRQLTGLVRSAVEGGKSDSVLVLGPRGAGKTALVDHVLGGRSGLSGIEDAIVVRLSGLVQSDDRAALKEMTRQMKLDNVVGDKVFGTSAEHLDFLLRSLKSGDRLGSKPILLVLDEFDRFCVGGDSNTVSGHSRQMLIYNLFDAAVACQSAPILIIGVSARLDIVEGMEKRVKSRFGHRAIYMSGECSFDRYYELAQHFLTSKSASTSWNKSAEHIFKSKETKHILFELFKQSNSIATLKQFIYMALQRCIVEKQHDEIDLDCFTTAQSSLDQNCEESVISDLCVLDLVILIACRHLHRLRDEESFNFAMAHHMYRGFVGRKCSSVMNFDKSRILKSWETLLAVELIRPSERNSRVPSEYRDCKLDIDPRLVDRVVQNAAAIPQDIREWARSELHT